MFMNQFRILYDREIGEKMYLCTYDRFEYNFTVEIWGGYLCQELEERYRFEEEKDAVAFFFSLVYDD